MNLNQFNFNIFDMFTALSILLKCTFFKSSFTTKVVSEQHILDNKVTFGTEINSFTRYSKLKAA